MGLIRIVLAPMQKLQISRSPHCLSVRRDAIIQGFSEKVQIEHFVRYKSLQSFSGPLYYNISADLCAWLQMLLESHQGWHQRFQRCKDRFEGLLKIDKLKKDATKPAVPAAAASQRASATAAPSGEQHCAA